MCMAGGGDGPDFAYTYSGVARREHKCYECGRAIRVGEPFVREFIVWERGNGGAGSFIACSHCEVLQGWLGANCEGWVFGKVIEDIAEHARDYKRADLARLVIAARNQWRWFKPERHAFPGRPIPIQPRDVRLGDSH